MVYSLGSPSDREGISCSPEHESTSCATDCDCYHPQPRGGDKVLTERAYARRTSPLRGSPQHAALDCMFAIVTVALVSLGAASCLPVDTRPPAGSILLTLTSDDEPSVTTADGWSIAVDRLLLGIGNTSLGNDEASWSSSSNQCTHYSDAHYGRLLDGRLRTDQKVGTIFGLGQCNFYFRVE